VTPSLPTSSGTTALEKPATGAECEDGSEDVRLIAAVDCLLRFGALCLRSGTTAFHIRQLMGAMADAMGVEALAVHVALGGITATARRRGSHVTLAGEIAPIGISAWRIGALDHVARTAEPGISAREVTTRLDAIEATPPLHSAALTTVAVGAACGAFSYLNGGAGPEVFAALVGGGIGQWLRSLLFRQRINQYAVTALCAAIASSLYCVLALVMAGAGFGVPEHAAGFISSVLFLIPGFPLVAGLLDLLQHQIVAALTRLAYGVMVLLAAAFGVCLVAAAAGLTVEGPLPLQLGEPLTLLLRGVASIVGGCGFAILYNSTWRTVLAVGGLALVGNELRLALHDLGLALAPATFLGAMTVGLVASIVRRHLHEPRIALTVPGIIIMVPGTYAFQTVVLFDQGDVLPALHAAVLGGFIIGAMALGLAAARLVTERAWLVEA
jgi:uncharacterized membrane protein YjjP (DUF1212 family)